MKTYRDQFLSNAKGVKDPEKSLCEQVKDQTKDLVFFGVSFRENKRSIYTLRYKHIKLHEMMWTTILISKLTQWNVFNCLGALIAHWVLICPFNDFISCLLFHFFLLSLNFIVYRLHLFALALMCRDRSFVLSLFALQKQKKKLCTITRRHDLVNGQMLINNFFFFISSNKIQKFQFFFCPNVWARHGSVHVSLYISFQLKWWMRRLSNSVCTHTNIAHFSPSFWKMIWFSQSCRLFPHAKWRFCCFIDNRMMGFIYAIVAIYCVAVSVSLCVYEID